MSFNNEDIDETQTLVKNSIIKEKLNDITTIQKNIEKIITFRFFSSILAGIIAGTLALSGILGIGFYFINFLFTSIFVYIFMSTQKGNFFSSFLNMVLSGLVSHGMVYTIFWVMFYNLVYIYI